MVVFNPPASAKKRDAQTILLKATTSEQSILAQLSAVVRDGASQGAFKEKVIITSAQLEGRPTWFVIEDASALHAELEQIKLSYQKMGKEVPQEKRRGIVDKYSDPDRLVGLVDTYDSSVRVSTFGSEKGKILAGLLKERLISEGLCEMNTFG